MGELFDSLMSFSCVMEGVTGLRHYQEWDHSFEQGAGMDGYFHYAKGI